MEAASERWIEVQDTGLNQGITKFTLSDGPYNPAGRPMAKPSDGTSARRSLTLNERMTLVTPLMTSRVHGQSKSGQTFRALV